MKHTTDAFSLIELMVTVVIIAVLAGIGIPLYLDHLAVSHRGDGQVALLKLAGGMEQYYLQHHSYYGANFDNLQQAPLSPQGYYQLAIQLEQDGQSYRLQAIPLNSQARWDAACGILQLSTDGRRSFLGRDPNHRCW